MSRSSLPRLHKILRFFGITLLVMVMIGGKPAGTVRADERVRVRLGVVEDGITVVTPDHLLSAGLNPQNLDPRDFALSSLGQPVSILVTGESDGRFDQEDRLYFFGQRYRSNQQDEKYTDERIYWLDVGGVPGPRISTENARASGQLTPPADFPATVQAEESRVWWTLHTLSLDTQDTWFWDRLTPIGTNVIIARDLPYVVPDPVPNAPATLSVEFISRSHRPYLYPDHRTAATINGQPVFDLTWDGLYARRVLSGPVPSGALQHGPNTVRVSAWALDDPTAAIDTDDIYVNYWRLDYRRLFRADNGQLDFPSEEAGDKEFLVSGWDTPDVLVWSIADPSNPVQLVSGPSPLPNRLMLPLISAKGTQPTAHSFRFRASGPAGVRYWMQARNTVRPPASIRLRPATGLRDPLGGADAVIVTSAQLQPAAERLAAWHRSEGRRALVVDIRDAYDEFEDGIAHPRAVQRMLAWASTHWQQPGPTYLTLVGDGHWNFKGYPDYPNPPNHIPPYLSWVDPYQGEVPTDNRFGDLDDNRKPEIAVGRLAVNTLAEANIVVDKILSYDQTTRSADWQRKALFVSDNPDDSGNFPVVSDEIVEYYTPPDLQVVKAYLPGLPPDVPATGVEILNTRAIISSTIQSGVWMVQYNGHGAPERWTHESIWHQADIKGLSNGDQLPFVMTFNCLDGYFVHPVEANYSLAELMQRQNGGGAIAAVSPTGLGTTFAQQAFRKMLLDTMFKDNVQELGRALLLAKQKYHAAYSKHYLIETMTLFGDPALRLPGIGN